MIIGDMEIRLRADIARLQRDMDDARRVVGDAIAGMARAADAAKSALAGIAGGIGLSKIVELSDEYAKLTAQLRLATDGARAYSQAYADVKRIASSAQSDLSATASLYASLSRATKELGVSQKGIADITEAVSLAFQVSGAGAQESAGAILQLSQAFAAGALRGDEFNSVNEAAPRLMQAIADSIGKPVGALRDMAAQGKLTSELIANTLPRALDQLRSEASQVETISDAFTVLKNNVLEFTGVQAQASGAVTAATGTINLLANNLSLVGGAIATVIAVKLGNWLANTAEQAISTVRANTALRASTLAAAQADALATTQASLLANERLAEARAATLAASGATQIALATNALIPAQARATAAAAAQEVSMLGLAAAQRTATIGSRALSAALSLTGGPLGLLVTGLGVAATAWGWYQSKQAEANAAAAADTKKSAYEIMGDLDKQIEKLKLRAELAKQGASGQNLAAQGGESADMAAEYLVKINELKAKGAALTASEQIDLINYQGLYGGIVQKAQTLATVKADAAANDSEALLSIRQRLTGVNQQYLDDLNKLQVALEKGGITQASYVEAVSKLAKDTYEASAAGKQYAQGLDAQAAAIQRAADAQGLRNQREQEHIQFLKNSAQADDETTIRAAAIAQVKDLNDQIAAQQRLLGIDSKRQESAEQHAEKQAEIRGKIASLRIQIDNAQAKREEDLSLLEQKRYRDAVNNYADLLEAAQKESKSQEDAARDGQDEIAMLGLTSQQIASVTAQRLRDQAAMLEQRAALQDLVDWTGRLGDESRRQAEALRAQAGQVITKEELTRQKEIWDSIESTAHDTFISIFDSGKSAFDRLRDALKNGLLDMLYQMTLKKWIINIGAMVTGGGVAGVAAAATGGSGGGSGVGGALSGIGTLGSLTSGVGLLGAGGLGLQAGFGALMSGGLAGISSAVSGGIAAIGAGTSASIAAGMGTIAGALGPIALGVAGIVALVNKLDHSGTPHTGGAASASAAGVQAINAGTLGLQRIDTSAAAQELTSKLASSVVSILDSTAAAFGKTAGYTAATAFADDSSKDGAWGALIIKNMNGLVSQWGDANSKWAPSVFADGAQGQQQYLDAISKSTRAALDQIGLPSWAKKMLDDLGNAPALEDLAKTVDAVNATQKALAIMGERLVGLGRLSDDATSALLSAAGGIDALAANAGTYYDAFYSDAEKTKVLSGQVAEALQQVGLTMPTTRDAYRAQVEAQLALGAAGAPGAAALLGLAGAIDQLYPKAEAAKDSLAETNKGYQDQIDELVKAGLPAAQVRAMEIAGMDASTVALYDRLAALKKEASDTEAAKQRAEAVASERQGLQEQLDQLTLSSTELLDKQRAALDESNRALFDQVQAAQAAKHAVETQNSLLDLQGQIAELAGDKAGAAAVLEQQHAIALAALDPALRGATQQLWDLQAAAKATEQVKTDATALLGGVDSAFSVLQRVVDREKKAVQISIDAHAASVTKLQSLSQSLRSTLAGMQSPGQQLAARAVGQAQIRSALAAARAGGALPEVDKLKDALSAVQRDASDQFSSYTDYLRDLYTTQGDIGALADITDSQLSTEQEALEAAQKQLEALDGVLAAEQQTIDQLKGINTNGLTLIQAVEGVRAAVLAARANPVVASGSAVNAAYQQYLGRAPDAAGMQWWQSQAAAGVSAGAINDAIKNSPEAQVQKLYQELLGRSADAGGLDFFLKSGASMSQIAAAIKASDEYKLKVPGYASGGDFAGGVRAVGEVGVEIEATGPSRIHSTQSLIDALRNPTDNSAVLAAAVDRLTATVERQNTVIQQQGAALDAIQRNTRRQADTLDVVTEGGTAIRTKGGN